MFRAWLIMAVLAYNVAFIVGSLLPDMLTVFLFISPVCFMFQCRISARVLSAVCVARGTCGGNVLDVRQSCRRQSPS